MTKKNKKVLVIGAGGHARSVTDVIISEAKYTIAGLIDSFQPVHTICFGHEVIGSEQDIPKICRTLNVRRCVVAIGDNFQRQAMTERILQACPDLHCITTVHPAAVIGADVILGDGTVVMPGTIIVAGSMGNWWQPASWLPLLGWCWCDNYSWDNCWRRYGHWGWCRCC